MGRSQGFVCKDGLWGGDYDPLWGLELMVGSTQARIGTISTDAELSDYEWSKLYELVKSVVCASYKCPTSPYMVNGQTLIGTGDVSKVTLPDARRVNQLVKFVKACPRWIDSSSWPWRVVATGLSHYYWAPVSESHWTTWRVQCWINHDFHEIDLYSGVPTPGSTIGQIQRLGFASYLERMHLEVSGPYQGVSQTEIDWIRVNIVTRKEVIQNEVPVVLEEVIIQSPESTPPDDGQVPTSPEPGYSVGIPYLVPTNKFRNNGGQRLRLYELSTDRSRTAWVPAYIAAPNGQWVLQLEMALIASWN